MPASSNRASVFTVNMKTNMVQWALNVNRKPWEFSKASIKAAIRILNDAGYKNIATDLTPFLYD